MRRPCGALDKAYSTPYSRGLSSCQTSAAVSCWAIVAWARNSASHASLAMRVRLAMASGHERGVGDDLGVAVLVRGGPGQVVAAVGVRARLARLGVAVLRAPQAGVGRRVGHARLAARLHLLAQDGHDLGAQQLDLLERHLQRQAHRVDVPQLALVVAEALLELQRLLDHLLRAADAQRRSGHEVLEAVALAVDRRALEERAERADGVLRALGDERLPAEPDDRLLRGPVAVAREALAVEVHQRLEMEVGRQDVVGEVAVAVERGLLGDLRRA